VSRPGFALEVDERTPPTLVRSASDVRLERFSLGTQIVYPPDGQPWVDAVAATAEALGSPIDGGSIASRLWAGMRLTITFADVSVLTPAAADDPRRAVVEQLLTAAADVGVDDVVLIAATGLRRRLGPEDMRRLLGERVSRSFESDPRLRSHDASDDSALLTIGESEGVQIRFNRRVVESDLVIHVSVVTGAEHAGWDEFASGLASAETIDIAYGWNGDAAPVRKTVADRINVLSVAVVLGQPSYSGPVRYVSAREWEWSIKDQAAYLASRRALATAPVQAGRYLYAARPVAYPVLGVFAGSVDDVRASAQARLTYEQCITVKGSADVLVTGVPPVHAAAPDGDGSPLGAAWWVLRHAYGLGGEAPIVREGGAVIAFHPLGDRFSTRHHGAAADMIAEVLPETSDPAEVASRFLPRFAADPWYTDLYRQRGAYHPLHAFHQWFDLQPAIAALGDVIFVGANRRTAEVMGFRAATTYADALEIASTRLGRRPAITYVRDAVGVQVAVS
jgi:hypothetical protein